MKKKKYNKKYYESNRDTLLENLRIKRKSLSRKKKEKIKEQMRTQYRKRAYGITGEQLQQILLNQERKCAVCQKDMSLKRSGTSGVCVDHDHSCCKGNRSCGKCIRGLVCLGCNSVLGFSEDSIEILQRAIQYLKHHKDKNNARHA